MEEVNQMLEQRQSEHVFVSFRLLLLFLYSWPACDADSEPLAEVSSGGSCPANPHAAALLLPVDLRAQPPAAPPLLFPMLLLPPSARAPLEAPFAAPRRVAHVVLLLLPIALASPASCSFVGEVAP